MKMFRFLLTILALSTAFGVHAQEEAKAKFKLSGVFRTFGEYRDGFGRPLIKSLERPQPELPLKEVPASVLRARTRFTADYQFEKLTTKLTIQDTRSWGSQYITSEDDSEPVGVFEAWAKYQFTPTLGLKMGRQQITYGFNRLLDNVDFSNQGLSHDAAILQYETQSKTIFHAGFSKSSRTKFSSVGELYNVSGYHKHMAFGFFSTKITDELTLNLLDLYLSYQLQSAPESVRGKNTIGGNLIYDTDFLFADLTSYYQHAKWGEGDFKTVSAYMFAVGVGAKFGDHSVKLCYDSYSGQKADSKKFNTFDKLYGGGHRYLGHMDYFTSIPTYGINDIYLELKAKASEKVWIGANLHYFLSQQDVPDAVNQGQTLTFDKGLGFEADLFCTYKMAKEAEIKAGYSFYSPTETLRHLKGISQDADLRFANWLWMSVSFTPTFLNL